MAGATISLKDANGASATKTADSAGAYTFDVTTLVAPFVVTASLQAGDTVLSLTSMLAEKPTTGGTGTVNVTPLTHAMAALLAPNGNPEELAVPAVLKSAVTKVKLDEVAAKIRTAIENILKEAGLDSTKFDPVSTVFTANRQGADRVLELVRVEVTGQGVSLTNPSAQDDGNGSASVQITPATTSVSKLPAPPAGTVLDSLDHFETLFNACFADAPALRVKATDANGVPTSLSTACAAVPVAANYKTGGATSFAHYATLLKGADFTGAKFSKPERLFTTVEGKVFFRLPYKTAAGVGGIITDMAEQTNPAAKSYKWEIVGNQRDYDSTVDAWLENLNQLNPNTAIHESNKSQYRVGLRLFFDPINAAGRNVQVVRVKGPGLPAAGVVMHRSLVCGTNKYMTITSKTGNLVNSVTNGSILFNNSATNIFKLAGELKSDTYDWSKVGADSSWRDMPMSDADLAAIPSYAEYTWELWTFGPGRAYRNTLTNATPADFAYKQRLTSRPPSAGSLKGLPWNSIDANDFLNPTSVLAAPQPSVAVGWKSTAEPVGLVSAFGQKNAAATSTVPASFVGIGASTLPMTVKISDTTKTVSPALNPAGTASLAGLAGATPPIPDCASAQFPAFDAVPGTKDSVNNASYATYRELTVVSRTYNLASKHVINSWSNFIN